MDPREQVLRSNYCHRCRLPIVHFETLGEKTSFQPEVWQLWCGSKDNADHQLVYAEYAVFLVKESSSPQHEAFQLARRHFQPKCHCGSGVAYEHPVVKEVKGNAVRLLTACAAGRHQHERWVTCYMNPHPQIPDYLPDSILKIKVPVGGKGR